MQLALQGGGAKIVYLVAVLQAIETLEKDSVIEITRIAGTSAGAMAGALFAARVPMEVVKAKLSDFKTKLCKFPQPSNIRTALSIVRGNPIASTAALAQILSDLFKKDPINVNVVGDLKIPTLIMSANLFTGSTHTAEKNEDIVNALLDSSAIPVYFRLWTHARGGLVDGGICENLPLPPQTNKRDDLGPVVGVSFTKQRVDTIQGPVTYLKALLDTAIQNSVERALRDLGPDSVFPIRPSIGTYDFQRALSDDGGLGARIYAHGV